MRSTRNDAAAEALRGAPLLALLALLLGLLAAVLDRYCVLALAAAAGLPDAEWPVAMLQALAALLGSALLARWSGIAGRRVIGRHLERVLGSPAAGRPAPAAERTAAAEALSAETRRLIAALPSMLATLLTLGWLALHHTLALLVVGACCVGAAAAARPRLLRQRAGQVVLEQTEGALQRLADALAVAGGQVLAGVGTLRGFADRALWPMVDDSTRATSIHLQDQAWLSGLAHWLGLLIVALLIVIAPPEDAGWTAAIILVAATLHPARRMLAALPALAAVQARLSDLARLDAEAPAPPPPPSRWRTLTLRGLRTAHREEVETTAKALGPLDLDLHRGEIVALTGPDRLDGVTVLRLLAGSVAPDGGTFLLDDRPIPAAFLAGMAGGVFPGAAPPPPPAATPRQAALLARFALAAAPADAERSEEARRRFVAAELQDRPMRLYDTQCLALQPTFLPAHVETWREARAGGSLCVLRTDRPEILAIADRILRIEDGRIVAEDPAP